MKKLFFTFALILATITASAINLNTAGEYEVKQVVEVTGATATALYDRAIYTLSTITNGDMKRHIDYQDRNAATVIYKGIFDLGYHNMIIGRIDRTGGFTIKVRCKDGRAQVTVTATDYTTRYNRDGSTTTYTLPELLEAVITSSGKKRERGEAVIQYIEQQTNQVLQLMCESLKHTTIDDEF